MDAPSVRPGELLASKYRVESIIGEGGMGVVLAATNEALRQRVAIKVLRPGALGHAEAVGRFQREARVAARLRSEHVARVLDVSALPDGRPYMVMEMLEGCDLGALVEKGVVLPVGEAIDYVLQACEAIAEAHAAGIVHRDLKPTNLFLTRAVDGSPLVKVLDFGISKVDDAPANMQLTRTTEVIGSPSYMSPEQLRAARNVDPRSDIWALGVILYELLTGRLPFVAHTVTELVMVVATEEPRPASELRPDVPRPVSDIIARCLRKRPDERYQNVVELVHVLEPFAAAPSATVTDRVRAVAQSGRSLPGTSSGSLPAPLGPSSSARINVHGTSVAWGETHVPAPANSAMPPPRSKTAIVVAAVLGLLASGGAIATGVTWFVKGAGASVVSAAPPASASDVPLPPGRKDLPPIASAEETPAPKADDPAPDPPTPSALPSSRIAPKPARRSGASPKPTPAAPPDDLSGIGRR